MKRQFFIFLTLTTIFQTMTTFNFANNIRLESMVKVTEVTGNVATLEFSLKWDNAWRDSYNWDAVWIFLKYKTAGGRWESVYLEAKGHTFNANDGKSYTSLPGTTDGKTVGLFVLLNETGSCNPSLTCRLKWSLPAGLTKVSFENNDAFILVQGIEMVYIPYGAYRLGDASVSEAFDPVIIDSESGRTIGQHTTHKEALSLSAGYPKGYGGFHMMKYEVSQEQYVTFLNALTLKQQQELLPHHAPLKAGDYIFGDPKTPDYRNGIILVQKPEGAPMLFDNNLTPGEEYGQDNDGKYIPCNYISVQAMQAYCAWAGLRPPTELEFEKTCRRPLPDLPADQEYAWGNTSSPQYASSVTNKNTPREYPGNGQVNAGSRLDGPLRCGSFAAHTPGQQSSGATYWGVMELAGNLREIYAVAGNTTITSSSHGAGNYTTTLWGTQPTDFGHRGGSFASPAEALQTSDRSEMNLITNLNISDSTAGFRGVRTFALDGSGAIGIQPGSIALNGGGTTVCPGEEVVINSTAPASVSGMDNLPVNYLWYVDGVVLAETNETLKINNLTNTGPSPETHTIKRKAVCMLGEAETNEITISILPEPDFTLSAATASIDINGTSSSVTATASVTGVTLNFKWLYQSSVIASGVTYTPAASHFGNTPGTYTVTCEGNSGSCTTAPVKKEVTVKFVTQTAGTIALADGVTSICPEGKTITINNTTPATVSSGETIVYAWKINGAEQSGQNQATLTYAIPKNSGNAAVSYSFIRVAKTSEGTKETSAITVTAKPWPNFTINPTSAAFATTESGPKITATSSSSNTLSYVWKYGSSTVSSANTYTPAASTFGSKDGNYTVVCTSSLSGCTATATQNLSIALSTCGGDFTDPRDGKKYPTVKVGNQCWMARNLNYGTMQATNSSDYWKFDEAGVQKWCYSNSESNCTTYGALYEWWEVVCGGNCNGKLTTTQAQNLSLSSESQLATYGAKMVPGSTTMVQGICPDGWHLPSDAEWTTLGKVVTGWTIQLGGCRSYNGGSFSNLGGGSNWWSSTPGSGYGAWSRYLSSSAGVGTSFARNNNYRSYGFSVRCVRN